MTCFVFLTGCMGGHCMAEHSPDNAGLFYLHMFAILHSSYKLCMSKREIKIIPLKSIILAMSYLTVMIINFNVWRYTISMSYQVIFRSSSLLTNMLIGRLLFNTTYSGNKLLSAVVMMFGLILVSTEDLKHEDCSQWSMGLGLLITSMLISSIMGHLQTNLYRDNSHYYELILVTHIFGLPWLINTFRIDLYSIIYGIFQYMCIYSVYAIHSQIGTYHLNVLLTIRKIMSLVLSDLMIGQSFNWNRWFGIVLVFGTSIYIWLNKSESVSND